MSFKPILPTLFARCLTGCLSLILPLAAHAQYTADFQTNIISGVTSNWTGNYYVGNTNFADALLIQQAGLLSTSWGYYGGGYVGYDTGASNNSVTVTGSDSVWSNSGTFCVGYSGAGNALVISSGGKVVVSTPVSPSIIVDIGHNATASSNHVLVTGSGSVWRNPGSLYVGQYGSGNALTISNGGMVFSTSAGLGNRSSSSNNVAVVTGNGSVWKNPSGLVIGGDGADNRLLISDGGVVVNDGSHGFIGFGNPGSDNLVTVSGTGSIWSNRDLQVGLGGAGNQLVITNGGVVYASLFSCLGCGAAGSNNSVVVTGSGSAWYNRILYVGQAGNGNQLAVRDGGSVVASNNAYVGYLPGSVGNQLNIAGGSLYVTNATQNGVLEVRCGTLTLSAGTLQVDRFVMTNACGFFIRTGGTLSITTTNLDPNLSAVGDGIPNGWKQQYGLDPFDPNLASEDADGDGMNNLQEYLAGTDPTNSASTFRILGVEATNDDVLVAWATAGGRTNAVQSATDLAGGYTNVSQNIVLPGTGDTTTNYLDPGAVTNATSRFYRIRLVP